MTVTQISTIFHLSPKSYLLFQAMLSLTFLCGWIYSKLHSKCPHQNVYTHNVYTSTIITILPLVTTWKAVVIFPPKFLQLGHESNYSFFPNVTKRSWNVGQTKEFNTIFLAIQGKKHMLILSYFYYGLFLYVLFKMLMECICNSDDLSLNHYSPE